MIRPWLLLVALLHAGPGLAADTPRIAIIIDDLGYQLSSGRRALALPGAVSFAILPDAPRAAVLARSADEQGKEVLLHLPMQATGDRHPRQHTMTLDMSRDQLTLAIDTALVAVPNAIGINNHRGSLMTRHPGHMRWLMEEIGLRGRLFFVDSFTTHESVAMQIAAEAGVRAVKRDVFLDSDPDPANIRAEFERLKALARKQGYALAIGHPYDATLTFLEAELPTLSAEGIKLVPVSELVTVPVL